MLNQILALLAQVPQLVNAIRKSGIPVSLVSGALRLVADALDAADKATPKA